MAQQHEMAVHSAGLLAERELLAVNQERDSLVERLGEVTGGGRWRAET